MARSVNTRKTSPVRAYIFAFVALLVFHLLFALVLLIPNNYETKDNAVLPKKNFFVLLNLADKKSVKQSVNGDELKQILRYRNPEKFANPLVTDLNNGNFAKVAKIRPDELEMRNRLFNNFSRNGDDVGEIKTLKPRKLAENRGFLSMPSVPFYVPRILAPSSVAVRRENGEAIKFAELDKLSNLQARKAINGPTILMVESKKVGRLTIARCWTFKSCGDNHLDGAAENLLRNHCRRFSDGELLVVDWNSASPMTTDKEASRDVGN